MNIIFCAYRDWALRVLPHVQKHPRINSVQLVSSNHELEFYLTRKTQPDFVLFCGWSTPPSQKMVEMGVPMFTEHPACSDRYSLGSPLQNQILDGIKHTKHRLIKVGFPELVHRMWSHEVDMDLTGNMSDILGHMEASAKMLFDVFLDDYPNLHWKVWPEVPLAEQTPRRTPEQSNMTQEIRTLTARELYDRIRMLENPYPNAFLEDETGRVYFEKVSFKAK